MEDRYLSVEIGDVRTNIADTIATNTKDINERPTSSMLQQAVDIATNWITGENGGYVAFRKNLDGQPYEILITDTPDITTATKVWRWNNSGLGFSKSGYNGPYELAMTQDGAIVANFITAGTLNAGLIKAGILSDRKSKNTINMETGEVNLDCENLKIQGVNAADSIISYVNDSNKNLIIGSDFEGAIPGTGIAYDGDTVTLSGPTSSAYTEVKLEVDAETIRLANEEMLTFSVECEIPEDLLNSKPGAYSFVTAAVQFMYIGDPMWHVAAPVNIYIEGSPVRARPWKQYARAPIEFDKSKTVEKMCVVLSMQNVKGKIRFKHPKLEKGSKVTPWIVPLDVPGFDEVSQEEVFNKLTNNGQLQGLYMKDGRLYVNAEYIAAGILSAIKIQSKDKTSSWNLETGVLNLSGVFKTSDGFYGNAELSGDGLYFYALNGGYRGKLAVLSDGLELDAKMGTFEYLNCNQMYSRTPAGETLQPILNGELQLNSGYIGSERVRMFLRDAGGGKFYVMAEKA